MSGPSEQETQRVGDILVVDDEAPNRDLLEGILEAQGFTIRTAVDGEAALCAVDEKLPDTILLDVMMPGMDGFQVCRRLKGSEETAHVPILLVTALSEREDRITGIEAGADDFLQKPVDRTEVRLRVRNAVSRKHLFDELQEKYRRLQELEKLRDDLTRMLVHDMRSPLTAISTNLQLLEMSLENRLDDEVAEDLEHARTGVSVLMDMVNMILDVSRSDELDVALQTEEADLSELVEKAVSPLLSLAKDHQVALDVPGDPLLVECDPDLIRRTITNLFGNAVKFTPEGGAITVAARRGEATLRVEVSDTGPGVDPEERDLIFEQFTRGTAGRSETAKGSKGLGLSFCKLAVEAHGGRIGVESEPGQGSTFWFRLPLNGTGA